MSQWQQESHSIPYTSKLMDKPTNMESRPMDNELEPIGPTEKGFDHLSPSHPMVSLYWFTHKKNEYTNQLTQTRSIHRAPMGYPSQPHNRYHDNYNAELQGNV